MVCHLSLSVLYFSLQADMVHLTPLPSPRELLFGRPLPRSPFDDPDPDTPSFGMIGSFTQQPLTSSFRSIESHPGNLFSLSSPKGSGCQTPQRSPSPAPASGGDGLGPSAGGMVAEAVRASGPSSPWGSQPPSPRGMPVSQGARESDEARAASPLISPRGEAAVPSRPQSLRGLRGVLEAVADRLNLTKSPLSSPQGGTRHGTPLACSSPESAPLASPVGCQSPAAGRVETSQGSQGASAELPKPPLGGSPVGIRQSDPSPVRTSPSPATKKSPSQKPLAASLQSFVKKMTSSPKSPKAIARSAAAGPPRLPARPTVISPARSRQAIHRAEARLHRAAQPYMRPGGPRASNLGSPNASGSAPRADASPSPGRPEPEPRQSASVAASEAGSGAAPAGGAATAGGSAAGGDTQFPYPTLGPDPDEEPQSWRLAAGRGVPSVSEAEEASRGSPSPQRPPAAAGKGNGSPFDSDGGRRRADSDVASTVDLNQKAPPPPPPEVQGVWHDGGPGVGWLFTAVPEGSHGSPPVLPDYSRAGAPASPEPGGWTDLSRLQAVSAVVVIFSATGLTEWQNLLTCGQSLLREVTCVRR